MSSIYSPIGEYQYTPGWGKRWTLIPVTKYVPPTEPVSIAGIQAGTATLLVVAYNSALALVTLTQTIFDTTTRADSARILLTNSTGATAIIRGASIRAKAYTKLSGAEGYLHDKFVDYESIAKNGEQKFELGNDMVTTFALVNDLADYHWKDKKTRRHIYSLTLMGMQTFFEPGEWYTLTIGGAGEQEYISSVCICYGVRARLSATGLGQTEVAFREVYQNWVFDSNEVARSIASGKYGRLPSAEAITVIGSDVVAPGDFYCDGTGDQVEMLAAINAAVSGPRRVKFVGTFSLSTSITMTSLSDLTLDGYAATVTCGAIKAFTVTGCTNIMFAGFHLTGTNGDHGFYTFGTNLIFRENIVTGFNNGCFANMENGQIVGNTFDGTGSTGTIGLPIQITGTGNLVAGNFCKGYYSTNSTCLGIILASAFRCRISNNRINDIGTSTGDAQGIAVDFDSDDNIIQSNHVENTYDIEGGNGAIGIFVAAGALRTQVQNNLCYFNGKNQIDRYDCESATTPAARGETTNTLVSATFAQDNAQAHGGTYSYKFTKTAGAPTNGYAYLVDNNTTTDMHGLSASKEYTFTGWGIGTGLVDRAHLTIVIDEYYGGAWNETSVAFSTGAGWAQATSTITLNAGITGIRWGFKILGAAEGAGTYAYVDDLVLYDTRPLTNDYGNQYSDAGTGTNTNINSWQ